MTIITNDNNDFVLFNSILSTTVIAVNKVDDNDSIDGLRRRTIDRYAYMLSPERCILNKLFFTSFGLVVSDFDLLTSKSNQFIFVPTCA